MRSSDDIPRDMRNLFLGDYWTPLQTLRQNPGTWPPYPPIRMPGPGYEEDPYLPDGTYLNMGNESLGALLEPKKRRK